MSVDLTQEIIAAWRRVAEAHVAGNREFVKVPTTLVLAFVAQLAKRQQFWCVRMDTGYLRDRSGLVKTFTNNDMLSSSIPHYKFEPYTGDQE